VFDLGLAYFTFRMVLLRHRIVWLAGLAAVIVLLLPTVWLNSAMWGQADSIYAMFCLGGVYYLMRSHPWLACLFLGSAVAFKLQGVFILPLVGLLVLARRMPWHALLGIPAAYLAWCLPGVLLSGRPSDLYSIYAEQVGHSRALTANAPTVYQFFRIGVGLDTMHTAGVVFTFGLVVVVTLVLVKGLQRVGQEEILTVGLLFALLVPFFLPGMHERYFYVADVLSVIVAFWVPRLVIVPLLVQIASALSYVAFLFQTTHYAVSVDQRVLAAVMFAALLTVAWHLLRSLRILPAGWELPAPRGDADTAPAPATTSLTR
jgi:Gpi18-like mannosyltransferase